MNEDASKAKLNKIESVRITPPEDTFAAEAMRKLEVNAALIGAREWIGFEKTVREKAGEEGLAKVSAATDALKNFNNLQDKKSAVERAARKVPEIAEAYALMRKILPEGDSVLWATKFLVDAAGAYASPELQSEAAQAMGGMNDAELEAAKQRASKMDIR